MRPSGRFTVSSEREPVGVVARGTTSGVQSEWQNASVQMNLPFVSALSE